MIRDDISEELCRCPALVLAGGMGSRLVPAFSQAPKVLAPIRGRPFLAYLLDWLTLQGFREVVLCLGHRSGDVRAWVDSSALEIKVLISEEGEPLGTAGALRLACSRFVAAPTFFALNGDSFVSLDYRQMLRVHLDRSAPATLALVQVEDGGRYGTVSLDARGYVERFHEKSGQHHPAWINAGVYLFASSLMEKVPDQRPVSLEAEVLPALVPSGIVGFRCDGYFIDIGVPEDFARAQSELGDLR